MNTKKMQDLKKISIAFIGFSIVCIILFSLLFFSSFGIVNAQWITHDQIESFSVGNADGEIKDTLFVYIQNNNLFSDEVSRLLEKKLQSHSFSIQMLEQVNETTNIDNTSFLGITISEITTHYTPWSAEIKYSIFYYFSDIGNTMYFPILIDEESSSTRPAIIFNATQGAQFLNVGDIVVEASIDGFLSKPKMQQIFYDAIAESIYNQLI